AAHRDNGLHRSAITINGVDVDLIVAVSNDLTIIATSIPGEFLLTAGVATLDGSDSITIFVNDNDLHLIRPYSDVAEVSRGTLECKNIELGFDVHPDIREVSARHHG